MPRGGHNAKSVADHRLNGTFRRDRHAPERTPHATPRQMVAPSTNARTSEPVPPPPKHLSPAARREYRALATTLEAAGTWKPADLETLVNLALGQARLRDPSISPSTFSTLLATVQRTLARLGLGGPTPQGGSSTTSSSPLSSTPGTWPGLMPGDTLPHLWCLRPLALLGSEKADREYKAFGEWKDAGEPMPPG
jgi:hypothetical protein